MENKLTKDELVELVRKIIKIEGSEDQINEWMILLESSVLHPEVSDLIFYTEEKLTPEEIVERALSYKPILLPVSFEEEQRQH